MKISYKPIGIMHCELKDAASAPKFYSISKIKGTIEIYEPYTQGLLGLEELEHIVVLFHFHLSERYSLVQKRMAHGEMKGVFSLCSPMRPNPIGMSVLKLLKVERQLIYVDNVDLVDETPILDIKPYKPL
ncbi:MAG: tRNA (N6-threonylcarbamoyladenosine(37)-N6)-methyltransferase TrmO [Deltaproteobacteria bacterium]|nr:tRNA (N6-threonylcarbamoyladenosine(37)-N6)-methyltransferase TrmO [Deltaproteobacteria bacterium]